MFVVGRKSLDCIQDVWRRVSVDLVSWERGRSVVKELCGSRESNENGGGCLLCA